MIYSFAILATLLSLLTTDAKAGQIRLRAREHYEEMRFETEGQSATYYGFTNTIDAWYEEPFHYAIGFAGSPLFARLKTSTPASGMAKEIRLLHLGIEAKGFPWADSLPVFIRGGLYQATLSTNEVAGNLIGKSYLGGLGYEWNLGGLGLAPEMSWRVGSTRQNIHFSGTAPCIGVHFYKAL